MSDRRPASFAPILAIFLSLAGSQVRAAAAPPSGWSAPRTLSGCSATVGPRVAFPSQSPSMPTGPGAIAWVEDASCPTGSVAPAQGPAELAVTALGADGRPRHTTRQPLAGWSGLAPAAVGASLGRVAVASPPAGGAGASGGAVVLQGRPGGPLAPATPLPGALGPLSLARAYLGDAAVATVQPGPAIEVRVERYFRRRFGSALRIPIGPGRVSALTATMDYRSDVLVTWQQEGAIFARMLRASGRPEPTQRVGRSGPDPQLQALVSDNDHGMIAWSSSDPADPPGRTRVLLALSGAGVRFTGSRTVASFADPHRAGSMPGSLALVRLSTENVMLAWTDVQLGHFVVRAVPAVFAGRRPSARLSDPSAQSVLTDLAPGPAGEVVALWRSAPALGVDSGWARSELWAARAFIMRHGRAASHPAERVARTAARGAASVAVDPASDRAVAAWLAQGAHPRIEYAIGAGASGYRPRSAADPARPASSGTHWLRITLVATGAAVLLALTGLLARRRAMAGRHGGGR